jgi:hypothetical protein
MLIGSQISGYIGNFLIVRKYSIPLKKIEKKDEDFLLISSDIGNNFAEFEYLFRNKKNNYRITASGPSGRILEIQ